MYIINRKGDNTQQWGQPVLKEACYVQEAL